MGGGLSAWSGWSPIYRHTYTTIYSRNNNDHTVDALMTTFFVTSLSLLALVISVGAGRAGPGPNGTLPIPIPSPPSVLIPICRGRPRPVRVYSSITDSLDSKPPPTRSTR